MTDDLTSRLRRLAGRPLARWLAGGAVVVLGVAAVGVLVIPTAPEADTRSGATLRIAVRAPPERVHLPGEVMEVGVLTDELDPAALARAEAARREAQALEQAYLVEIDDPPLDYGDDAGPPHHGIMPYGEPARVILTPPPRPENPIPREFAGRPFSFGFDIPRPDFEAERHARRLERDARMAERERRRAERRARDIQYDYRYLQ